MSQQLLRNKDVFPSKEELEKVLGSNYLVFNKFIAIIEKEPYNLIVNWNYYNDGKAWLGKIEYKKKTVFWLSIWEGFFKTSFFFTEKNEGALFDLSIDKKIIQAYRTTNLVGKLRALVLDINNLEQVNDLLRIIDYKKSIK